jgi:transposase
MTKQSDIRKRVHCCLEKHKDKTKKFIADHFMSEEVSESTIYDILKRKESGSDYIRLAGSGRPANQNIQ